MKRIVKQFIKKYLAPKAVILMYHRVAEPESDVWEISVSPQNFEQQLQVLEQLGSVVALPDLTHAAASRTLRKNSIAISFDDGYRDNYETAVPLLQKHGLPATFFIASGNIGAQQNFWWDELETLLLYTPKLPQIFSSNIGNELVEMDLRTEEWIDASLVRLHQQWKACTEEPPTLRSTLYYRVWQLMKPLPHKEQQMYLQRIREWAGASGSRKDSWSMSLEQLQNLAAMPQFTIGAHTVNHLQLGAHDPQVQKNELETNRKYLQQVTGKQVDLVAYPYGNFNGYTMASASELGFKAGFSTQEVPVTPYEQPFSLPRFQVKNWSGPEFAQKLQQWLGIKISYLPEEKASLPQDN